MLAVPDGKQLCPVEAWDELQYCKPAPAATHKLSNGGRIKRLWSQDSSQSFPKKTQPFGWALSFRSPLLPVSFRSLVSLIIPPERFYLFRLLIRFTGSEILILQCFFDLKTLFCHRTYLLLKILEV